jgi:hypothetical protein
MKTLRRCLSALLFALLIPLSVQAVMNLNKKSQTVYTLDYTDFANVYGIELSVRYDPKTTIVQIDQGPAVQAARALFSSNDFGGRINVAAITSQGFPALGTLATITLASVNKDVPPGAISFSLTKLTGDITSKGTSSIPSGGNAGDKPSKPDDTTTGTWKAPDTPVAPPSTTTPNPVSPSSSGTGTIVTSGSVTIPGDPLTPASSAKSRPEDKAVELETAPARKPESSEEAKTAAETKAPEKKSVQLVGMLQRFNAYAEELTPAALMGLFVDPVDPLVKQDPAIVFADGTSTMKITINAAYLTTSSPTLQLKGAKLLGLTSENGTWFVNAVTREKITDVQLLIIDGERTITVPVTVVPKIKLAKDKAGKVDATEFARVLADRGNKKPKYDFNADGVHDAADDYIYTANYLKQTGLTPVKPKKPAKSAAKPAGEAKDTKPAVKDVAAMPKDDPAGGADTKKKKK